MPARPLIDKTTILRLLDEFAEVGLSEQDVDRTLVRDGPVDLDLLAECKREHPHFNGFQSCLLTTFLGHGDEYSPPFWPR